MERRSALSCGSTEAASQRTIIRLFVALGLESKVDHVAFEVVDLDAVEMGQQVLMARKYRHAWGVGTTSPRQSDLRLLARSVGPEARALRGRRSVRRPAASRLSRPRSRRALSMGPRPSRRLHRRQAHAAAARLGLEDGDDRQAASQEDARAQEQRVEARASLAMNAETPCPEAEEGYTEWRSRTCPTSRRSKPFR